MATHFTASALDAAFAHVCQGREHWPVDSDIWDLRFHWASRRAGILDGLNAGTYQLSPMALIPRAAGGEGRVIWGAQDAVVLKLLTDTLRPLLPVHPRCEHLAGHGGGKQSVQRVVERIGKAGFSHVIRTDIKGYYANINKHTLYEQLCQYVFALSLRRLLFQFLHYSTECGGVFHTPKRGMCRASALSPLLAAFHLTQMDAALCENPRWYYVRYMDDVLIFTRSAWQLRRAVRALMQWFNHFGFARHPDKTFTGKVVRGFDWMGFWLTPHTPPCVAPRARQNHLDTLRRLYERTRYLPAPEQAARVAAYRAHWQRWARQWEPLSALAEPIDTMNPGETARPEGWHKSLPLTR